MAPNPETLFKPGTTYRVLKDEDALRDHFAKGQVLTYWRHAYSFYDGLHGWFFYDEHQKVWAWDKPEVDPVARDALFVEVKPEQGQFSQELFNLCRQGDGEGLRTLLQRNQPPSMVRKQAFELACQAQAVACAVLLATLPGLDEHELASFTRHAVSEKFNAGVLALLEAGIPINAVDSAGQTLLMGAVWNGDLDLVDTLLAQGADPSRKTNSGSDALSFARAWRHEAVIARLEKALRKGTTD